MPPGVSRTNSKKRKASEEADANEFEEQPETLVAGRQRRSAAMKSHIVWDQLKPGAKSHLEDYQEAGESQPAQTASTKRPRITPKKGAQKNVGGTPNVVKQEKQENPTGAATAETPGQKSIKVEVKPSPTVGGTPQVKFMAPQPPHHQQQPGGVVQRVILSKKVTTAAARTFQPQQVQQQKQAMTQEQLELIEREMEKHHEFDEPDEELPTDEEDDDDEDEDEDEFDDDEEDLRSAHVLLDDPNDDDYMDFPSIRDKRGRDLGGGGARGRGRGGGPGRGGGMAGNPATMRGDAKPRGRPRGSGRAGAANVVTTAGGGGIGSGLMRGRVTLRQPMNYYAPPPLPSSRPLTNGIFSLQPTAAMVGSNLGAIRPSTGQPVVRVLRPAGMPLQTNFNTLRPASINMNPSIQHQQHQHLHMVETNFAINRELENYRNRIVAGSSVQDFNDAIDHLLSEYQRVVDDRSRLIASHREYVNHLKMANQTTVDMKDNKIRQLEHTVEQLQQKLISSFKHDQLRVVKQGSMVVPVVDESHQPKQHATADAAAAAQQQQQQGAIDQQQHVDVGGGEPQQPQQQQMKSQNDDADDDDGNTPLPGQLLETGELTDADVTGSPPPPQQQQQQQKQQQQQITVVGGGSAGAGATVRHLWPPSPSGPGGQAQRIQILQMSSGGEGGAQHLMPHMQPHHNPPMGANAPYFDDSMDDEEFDDGGDSAELDDELGAQVTI